MHESVYLPGSSPLRLKSFDSGFLPLHRPLITIERKAPINSVVFAKFDNPLIKIGSLSALQLQNAPTAERRPCRPARLNWIRTGGSRCTFFSYFFNRTTKQTIRIKLQLQQVYHQLIARAPLTYDVQPLIR